MLRLPKILTILAAVLFFIGSLRCLFAWPFLASFMGGWIRFFSPETYWRGATGLLLFAITLLLMQRSAVSAE
jgi:hypothetical protein